MTWIVFSRNRTFQLDAFLSTLKVNGGIDPMNVVVLHRYDDFMQNSLEVLKNHHPGVKFVEETSFKHQILQLTAESSDDVVYATDDALITRKIDTSTAIECLKHDRILTYSCRLGLNIDYCYPLDKQQPPPSNRHEDVENNVFMVQWKRESLDWNYPLSLDGHFFRKKFLEQLLPHLNFKNPNTMEAAMSEVSRTLHYDIMACPLISCYFSSPINIVQEDFKNRNGGRSVEELNEKFERNERFDPRKVLNRLNKSPHEVVYF